MWRTRCNNTLNSHILGPAQHRGKTPAANPLFMSGPWTVQTRPLPSATFPAQPASWGSTEPTEHRLNAGSKPQKAAPFRGWGAALECPPACRGSGSPGKPPTVPATLPRCGNPPLPGRTATHQVRPPGISHSVRMPRAVAPKLPLLPSILWGPPNPQTEPLVSY